MADTSHRNAFLIHLAAYVVVNAVLFAINASQSVPEGAAREWWTIYPLAGWGIGLAAHAFGLWAERHSHEGQLLSDPDARGVAVHLFVYLAVNAFLITINITESPETPWSIWPLLGWGIGLAAHAWLAYRAMLRRTLERYATEQQILSDMQLEKQLESQAAAIASQVEPQEKKKAPARRRRQAAKKPAKKTAARKGTTTKRAAAKSSSATRTRKSSAARKTASKAKKPAARKPASRARGPASKKGS